MTLRASHDVGHERLGQNSRRNDLIQSLEMLDVAFRMIEKEGHRIVCQPELFLDSLSPLTGDALAEPLDDEHGADQLERVLLTGLVENVRRQRLAADVLASLPDLVEIAADGRIVSFEHLEVPMFVAGVGDERGCGSKSARA